MSFHWKIEAGRLSALRYGEASQTTQSEFAFRQSERLGDAHENVSDFQYQECRYIWES